MSGERLTTVSVDATDIDKAGGYADGDTRVTVTAMRSVIFLGTWTRGSGATSHIELTHEQWDELNGAVQARREQETGEGS